MRRLDSEDAELAKLAAMDARFAPPAPALPARPADADGGEAPPPGDDDEAEPPPAGPGGAPFSPDMSLLQFTRRRPSALFRPPSPDNLVAPAYERFRRARDNSPSDAS